MLAARHLPRCHRSSSSTRCLVATCAAASRCCILQPPQAPACRPKWGQPGRTRCDDSWCRAVMVAASQLFFLRCDWALTHSPGKAPSMNTTLPSALWATPLASRSRDCTKSQSSWACAGRGAKCSWASGRELAGSALGCAVELFTGAGVKEVTGRQAVCSAVWQRVRCGVPLQRYLAVFLLATGVAPVPALQGRRNLPGH